jgi:hypothetical protein
MVTEEGEMALRSRLAGNEDSLAEQGRRGYESHALRVSRAPTISAPTISAPSIFPPSCTALVVFRSEEV